LSIIRWQNILITALAQYLAVLFVFNPGESKLELFLDIHLHLIVLATACAVAGGYIINSFYDLEKDLINRPERTLFNRVVSKDFCLKFYFLMNGLTMVFCLTRECECSHILRRFHLLAVVLFAQDAKSVLAKGIDCQFVIYAFCTVCGVVLQLHDRNHPSVFCSFCLIAVQQGNPEGFYQSTW
jgi:4-hydroxybenzoate polyprenyltransferase